MCVCVCVCVGRGGGQKFRGGQLCARYIVSQHVLRMQSMTSGSVEAPYRFHLLGYLLLPANNSYLNLIHCTSHAMAAYSE